MDAEEYRRRSADQWEAAAPGWAARQEQMRSFGGPVSHRLVEAIGPQPGHRVLELAAGLGETGFLAAELVAPGGGVITSDQSEAMLDAARARAQQMGVSNVEFRVINAEWIDLPVASVDAVLCRWGLMLMADPAAALLEARRVLRSGGRIALAVWDRAEHNPWASVAGGLLVERGVMAAAEPGTPGMFALDDAGRLREMLDAAGFTETQVDHVELCARSASFAELWEERLDLSPALHDAVMGLPRAEMQDVRRELARRLAPWTAADGSLAIPGRALVAAAEA